MSVPPECRLLLVRSVAIVAALVLLLAWPDTTLPKRYLFGFLQVGILEIQAPCAICIGPTGYTAAVRSSGHAQV